MNTIILGTNHNNTLGLIWSLGEAGHRIILLLYDNGNNYVSKSRFINKTVLIHKGDSVIDLIIKEALRMEAKPVVFVSNDDDATLLNDHYEELKDYCYFEGGRPDGSINLYRDKDEGEKLAQKCGFTIPQTDVITKPEELASVALPYPLFIKGNNSVHGGKAAMKKCDNQEAAEEFVNGLPQDYFPLQVQEFIEKEYELMILGCSLYGGKKIICPVANKKIRQYPKNTGGGPGRYQLKWPAAKSCGNSLRVWLFTYRRSNTRAISLLSSSMPTGNSTSLKSICATMVPHGFQHAAVLTCQIWCAARLSMKTLMPITALSVRGII